ncbi:MAG: TRAFs-binding domain-containing protein [Pseudomonadota bacterium]
MSAAPDTTDYIRAYEAAVLGLAQTPGDRRLQHTAVLALARAGSVDFALQEYERYGLHTVDDDEDIIALRGRLHKDRYERSDDKSLARSHARRSAESYDQAFRQTGGFYSAINAATMYALSGASREEISKRAKAVLKLTAQQVGTSPQDRYYLTATRAEALLLQGRSLEADVYLMRALEHDPLNYTAHASTLRQFEMILAHQGGELALLDRFRPPRSVFFVGHIFAQGDEDADCQDRLNRDEVADLKEKMRDLIQAHDIGFGYSALAAGSDLLFAETLLEEGGELNVILPGAIEPFIETSVIFGGASWEECFRRCLERAHSVVEVDIGPARLSTAAVRHAAKVGIGLSGLRGQTHRRRPALISVLDNHQPSFTKDIVETTPFDARDKLALPYPAKRKIRSHTLSEENARPVTMLATKEDVTAFALVEKAVTKALGQQSAAAIVSSLGEDTASLKDRTSKLLKTLPQGTVALDEIAAALLLCDHAEQFDVMFIGQTHSEMQPARSRLFKVAKRGS